MKMHKLMVVSTHCFICGERNEIHILQFYFGVGLLFTKHIDVINKEAVWFTGTYVKKTR